jgi:hypothetical protein
MNERALKPLPEPLPAKLDDWHRKLKAKRTITDLVEDVHKTLVGNERYLRCLYATYDEQAVEGATWADDLEAAGMIRDKALELDKNHPLGSEKKVTIARVLNVVLKRYGFSRTQRRRDDETGPDDIAA